MKKILPYILIVFTLVNFLAPVSIGISRINRIEAGLNKAEAAPNCIVTNITFAPPGELTEGTTTPLPSSIEATIKTQNCDGKKIDFWINETTGIDSPVLKETLIANSDTIVLKLNPTELKCGGNNICGFKYQVATEDGGWVWKSPNDIDTNYFYKCTSIDPATKNLTCSNNNPWASEIVSGAVKPTADTPDANFKIQMTGTVTATDKTATATMKVTDTTDYTSLGLAGNITYVYYLNITVKNTITGTPVDSKRVLYTRNQTNIDPVTLTISPATTYTLDGSIDIVATTQITGPMGSSTTDKNYPAVAKLDNPITFTSNAAGDETVNQVGNISASAEHAVDTNPLPACSLNPFWGKGTVIGCMAQLLYYVLFVPTSFVFALAGNFFDWTFAYSVSDSSYRTTFVTNGWALVRDFCNMFFIFVLLYVAFSTIIGNNGSKTKEMIMNVVIIGLLINFSLFATQIIIDTSNILARVFYNSNAISITQKGGKADPANGVTNATLEKNNNSDKLALGKSTTANSDAAVTGIIPLSAAIVNKINPQNLIINSSDVSTTGASGVQDTDSEQNLTVGRFILVVLLSTAFNVVGFMVFLTVALLFVARVVGLWIAMILSPLAFFSFMVPKLKSINTAGWDKWLPETVSLAFLAPIFIFFMYIILKFLEAKDTLISSGAGDTGIKMIIVTLVPFVFLMILMLRAKDIAKDMSGEFGKMMPDIGKMAGMAMGGATLGLAAGGAAKLGRLTAGKLGDRMDKAGWTNKMAGSKSKFISSIGNGLKNVGQGAAKSTFDARNTALGAMAGKNLNKKAFGKAKEGGYVKDRADKKAKKLKRAGELEVHEDEKIQQNINEAEMKLQEVLNKMASDLTYIDKQLEVQRQKKNDLAVSDDPDSEFQKTVARIKELNDMKTGLKNGNDQTDSTNRRVMRGAKVDGGQFDGKSVNEMDNSANGIITTLKNEKQAENRRRRNNYANNTRKRWGRANREAQHDIIMETKLDSGAK